MTQSLLACLLLSIATGLSMRRFLLPYLTGGDLVEKRAPATIVASSVVLASLAFTVSDQPLWAKFVVLAFSLLLAVIFNDSRAKLPVVLSVISLAAYLGLRSVN